MSKYKQLNCKILRPFFDSSELNGMKNLAIENRVLQRDRVLQRRVLERYYCNHIINHQLQLSILIFIYVGATGYDLSHTVTRM